MSTTTVSTTLNRLTTSFQTPTGKLVLVALATTAFTTLSILSTQSIRRHTKRSRLRDEVEDSVQEEGDDEMEDFTTRGAESKGKEKAKARKKKTSEVIIKEALARNYVFFGDEGMGRIRDSFVIVVGLGGVGSACATMLVRSGVRKIRLIDFDQVSLSSLNRHSTATLAQVGTPKVTSCAEYFESVAPWVEVDARIELFGKETADELLSGKPDFVIDAIDNLESKVDLLVYCHQHQIPVFSSLGAASKSDASRIQIADISTTFEDPLARTVRRKLKLQGVHNGIPVVYSTEKPRPEIALLPLPDEEFNKGKVDELSAIANFRVRILPVLGPLPAMFGNAAAAYVLQKLAGFKVEPLPIKDRHKTAITLHKQLLALETKLNGVLRLPFNEQDVLYMFEEIHRARSVVPPFIPPSRPHLMVWRKERGLVFDNLVVFERDGATKHEERCLVGDEDPDEVWGPETTALVRRRAEEERRLRKYRM